MLQQFLAHRSTRSQAPPPGPPPARKAPTSAGTKFLYFLWFIILCDPQWWIASFGPRFVLKVPTVLFALVLLITVLKGPRNLFPPLLLFFAYMVLGLPFSYNRGLTLEVTKLVFTYYVLALATLTAVRSARETVPIVLGAMLFQYTWWVVLGAKNGLVPWHYSYSNYDGYGPLMVLGLGATFYMGWAAKDRRLRTLAFITAAGCIIAVVSSFARGAVLSGVVVAAWVWFRSKQRLKTALLGVGGAIVLFVSTNVLFTNASRGDAKRDFWAEMRTILSPADDGTRQDRYVIWALARRVYRQHPFFGVGPECFGPYAAENFAPGTVGGAYEDNPGRLWGKALHNTYYQILSEFGTVGAAIFLWMLWDFFKRNRALRRPERMLAWATQSGGRLDLWYVSLALEAGMLGYLLAGYFYNVIFGVPWFYTTLTINALLFQVTRSNSVLEVRQRRP